MAKDHYISQVYLKNFYSPELGGKRMHAIRKTDLHYYQCDAYSQCRIEQGSTNLFLREPRVIEEYLKFIEPNYNSAVQKFRERKFDQDAVYVIAGLIAYFCLFSPAGMRLATSPVRELVKSTAILAEEKGMLPSSPKGIEEPTLVGLLNSKKLKIQVDPKYPQAYGIDNYQRHIGSWGNSHWVVLLNQSDVSYLTSDYPVYTQQSSDLRVSTRLIPLAPDIAIRICPDVNLSDNDRSNLGFPKLTVDVQEVDEAGAKSMNKKIVQAAETTVYFRDNSQGIRRLIENNRHYKTYPETVALPTAQGRIVFASQSVKIEKSHL